MRFAGGTLAVLLALSARAGNPDGGPKLVVSANVALATEYVFRGFSQTAENPAIQGGVDATYGIGYLGVWASNLDFGSSVANIEIDWFGGVKPKWSHVELDLGVLYYTYPSAADSEAELDYLEWKVGVSGSAKKLDLGITAYYSEEYTARSGEVWTVEGNLELALPEVLKTTPLIGGVIGTSIADSAATFKAFGNGEDDYVYWSVGVEFPFMKNFSLGVRYWDTEIDDLGSDVPPRRRLQINQFPVTPPKSSFCSSSLFQCDERFVAMLSASF